MSNSSRPLPARFVGRDATLARFRARLSHFRFFLYGGISGIGKTALLMQLAEQCHAQKLLKGAIYMPVHAGERIAALGARLSMRLEKRRDPMLQGHTDPYARLLDLLSSHEHILILDDLHHLRRDELTALIRLCARAQTQNAPFRLIGAMRGDPELSVMDLSAVHFERIGALNRTEVEALAKYWHLSESAIQCAAADALRGGAIGQALTGNHLMALTQPNLVPPETLARHTSRSVHAYKALVQPALEACDAKLRQAVANLAQIQHPIAQDVAVAVFGADLQAAVAKGLVDVVAGDVYVHDLLAEMLPTGIDVPQEAAQTLAKHLCERAVVQGEPHAYLSAGELLWRAGLPEAAVEIFAQASSWARDAGFVELYLARLKQLPKASDDLWHERLRLLVAQARQWHTHASVVLAEMQALAGVADLWTRSRAYAALTALYSELKTPEKAIEAFETLSTLKPISSLLLQAGMLAAEAMVACGQQSQAEALIQKLLQLHQKPKATVSGKAGKAAKVAEASQEAKPDKVAPQESLAEATLRRHLADILAHTGRLEGALEQATLAAKAFDSSGDAYQAALAHSFVGDLQRELGAFVEARTAHAAFLQAATESGDRDLMQIAQLADAWVALDIGDVAHAAKRVQAVKKDLSAAPSRQLKRYLDAAEGMLEAGRGHHERAATLLARVVDAWEAAGQRTIAGTLNAQLVRSLIASDKLAQAESIVRRAMSGAAASGNTVFLASLKREQALIRLRRGEVEAAITDLAEARQLFAKANNRREEALTLHRIGYAALDEGNVKLAKEKASETYALATKIKHARAKALARELMARIALLENDPATALTCAREAQQALRRLGDELGMLHVSEILTQAYLGTGDLASAIKLGVRISALALQAGMRDLRIRMIVLTGIGLWRRGNFNAAARCFRPLNKRGQSPWTYVLMWRFGESLALSTKNFKHAAQRRQHWIAALSILPEARRNLMISTLQQFNLTPRDRCVLLSDKKSTPLNTETLGLCDGQAYPMFFDVLYRHILIGGKALELTGPMRRVLLRLVLAPDAVLPWRDVLQCFELPAEGGATAGRKAIKNLSAKLTRHKAHLEISSTAQGLQIKLHSPYAVVVPVWRAHAGLSDEQVGILKQLRMRGLASMSMLQQQLQLGRGVARREIGALVEQKLIELVREGRGQAYRLA